MNFLPFPSPDSAAGAVLLLSLVAGLGLAVGSLRWRSVSLGVAGVLFTGLFFGHLGVTVHEPVLEFTREFGLVLFVYGIGLQVGPGFFSSLRHGGLVMNLLAAGTVLLGAGLTAVAVLSGRVDLPAAAGVFSGASTNTPSLAAAQQAVQSIPALADQASRTALGYAAAYPFGIVGIILTMLLVKTVFRVAPEKELEEFTRAKGAPVPPVVKNFVVRNPRLAGLSLREVPLGEGVVISRVLHDGRVRVADPALVLSPGDVVIAVGPAAAIEKLKTSIGEESAVDLRDIDSGIESRRVLVSRTEAAGKTLEELGLRLRHGVNVTRVTRAGIDFPALPGFQLRLGDNLLLVGEEAGIAAAANRLGNSVRELDHPQLVPYFVGIAAGVLLGSLPIFLPGLPAPLKLGLAGGVLIVALLASWLGQIGPLVWYVPPAGGFTLREVGLALFLSCVGLKAGGSFVSTLVDGPGLAWALWGAGITLLPLLLSAAIGRVVFKLNYVNLCGLLAGSMTNPASLSFANNLMKTEAVSAAYATVYPVTMILRLLCAQALVLFLA